MHRFPSCPDRPVFPHRLVRLAPLILILVVQAGIGISTRAWTADPLPGSEIPAAGTAPSTTIPVPNFRYERKPGAYKACVARVAAQAGKPCDIIFVGDSITERWLVVAKDLWASRYAVRHAFDFGVSADQIQNVLWRFDHLDVKNLAPKVAVLMLGTNNTKNAPQEIADGDKAVIAKLQALYPGIKVILVSILPNRRANALMMAANALLKPLADDQQVWYLDLVPLMPPVTTKLPDGTTDTNWKGMGSDHLHPDLEGYTIWSDAMEPLLSRLLAAPARP
jgi:lysophospholipase L1-like esterase